MAESQSVIYTGNDNLVDVTSLTDEADETIVLGATLNWRILTQADVEVIAATPFIEDAAGRYYSTIEEDAAIVAGTLYKLEVSVDAGSDRIALGVRNVLAQVRGI
jgi:hypothetical protein